MLPGFFTVGSHDEGHFKLRTARAFPELKVSSLRRSENVSQIIDAVDIHVTVHKPRGKDRKFIAITLGCVSKTEHTHLKRELQKHKLESLLGLLAKIECNICSYQKSLTLY